LERFRRLSPEQRWALAQKAAGKQALYRLGRADLVVSTVARGSLAPAQSSDIYCTARCGTKGSAVTATIKWIIDEGTVVKKGDKVVELDASGFRDQLREIDRAVDAAHAAVVGARESLKMTELQNDLDIRSADIALKIATIERKKYAGKDANEKEILDLKIEQSRLNLETIKRQNKAKLATAAAELKPKETIHEQELARKKEIEGEIARCTILAPQDGLVVYFVPEQVRGGGGAQQSVVALGEPVREGQKMLQIPDLSKMLVNIKVHDSVISRVRIRQPVLVRVDAFAGRLLGGRVISLDSVATAADWFASDVKLFGVRAALTDSLPGLKPGMSAEVHFELARLPKILQVPIESVIRTGSETYCYVKVDKGLQERAVKVGTRNDLFVEITDGLKEDEEVLRAPGAVARSSARTTGKGPGQQAGAGVLVKSVDARAATSRRSWVASYGLTYTDLERIRALPDVTSVAGVRGFPGEVRYLDRTVFGHVVATVPEYGDLAGVHVTAGRFLDDEDGEQLKNVAVLGADAAETLFPEADPLGKVVRVNGSAFVVVGVLEEQIRPAGSLSAQQGNHGVYLPLRTAMVRFGERVIIQRAGSRTAEAVQLSEILVDSRSTARARFVADCISDLLEEMHARKEWEVRVATSAAR
jgi:multidrug resistance efflux pump